MRISRGWLWLAVVVIAVSARPAHAYLDPSTGSMLVSAVVAAAATVALGVRTFWYRMVGWLRAATGRGSGPGPAPRRED